nr:helix-turn-helix domain-containing protein [Actinomycetales bacterium]
MARLTDKQVADLRTRYADGAKQKTLSEDFGITQTAVSAIVRGKTRADAGGPIAEPPPRKARSSSGGTAQAPEGGIRGSRPPLTTDDVAEIRSRVAAGEKRVAVAESYGISRWTVDSIMVGRLRGRDPVEVERAQREVREIRQLAESGTTQREIAEQFGLTQQAVSQIVRGVTRGGVAGES